MGPAYNRHSHLAWYPLLFAFLLTGRLAFPDELETQKIKNSVGMKLVRIAAGSYTMGSPKSLLESNKDERPPHQVQISHDFYMGTFEVTQAEFEMVMGFNPSHFSKLGRGSLKVTKVETNRFPVERITWQQAVDFCQKLSSLPGEKAARRVYRLPTEAQWEYACRAGTASPYHVGDSLNSRQANFNGKFPSAGAAQGPFVGRPAVVGSYPPNAWGLYDMHGNVWEWCSDWYRSNYYETSPPSDPPGAESGGDRSVRGGSWADDALNCRSGYRYNILPVYKGETRGFRVAMTIATPAEMAADKKLKEKTIPTAVLSKEAIEREQFFQNRVVPFLKKHCYECHSGEKPSADLPLDAFQHATSITTTGHKTWKKVADQLLAGVMPPKDSTQPTLKEKNAISKWISGTLSKIDCSGPVDPGHETVRRLNRMEYRNTIRDLLGVDYTKAESFPTDDIGAVGDALTLPTLLMERYVSAAVEISEMTIQPDRPKNDQLPTDQKLLFVKPDHNLSPQQASRQILKRLAGRAFRRPATDVELERLVRLSDSSREQGGNFEDGIRLGMQAILVSPHFLFKVEKNYPLAEEKEIQFLDEFELATRLSYFLWSSMPDEELFRLARDTTLRKNLAAQLARMIADKKSTAFIKNLASTWLQLDQLDSIQPNKVLFTTFGPELRRDMRTETEKLLETLIREDGSLLDLIDADFTFLNERLAKHYQLEGINGAEFRRVSLANSRRKGLLSHASILTLTSNPTRTSPIKRGQWILANLLGAPPPAPPPGVSVLAKEAASDNPKTLRQRMEIHRKNPRCASCHEPMDSLGFALENYDAIGRWRTTADDAPIDASGSFPGGETFEGPQQLIQLLRKHRKREFARCVVQKILAYALGRELEYYDQCTVIKIVEKLENNDFRFSTLIGQIIKSEAFQKNRAKTSLD